MVADKILRSFAYRRFTNRRANLPSRNRLTSAVLGGAALAGPPPFWPAGAWLLYRAATGRSYLYENAGIRPIGVTEAVDLGVERGMRFDLVATVTAPPARAREVFLRVNAAAPDGSGAPLADAGDGSLAWRTEQAGLVASAGKVTFEPLSHGRGTVIRLHYAYRLPAAGLRAVVARVSPGSRWRTLKNALAHAKQIVETGEIPTTAGQPTGEGRAA